MGKKLLQILLVLVLSTGCSILKNEKKSTNLVTERSAEYLLDQYVIAFLNADADIMNSIMPSYTNFTKEKIESQLNSSKEYFGNDLNVTYNITAKNLVSSDVLNKINNQAREYFNSNINATQCYYLDGTMTLSGSNNTDTSPLDTYYCMYNGEWYIFVN